MASAMLETVAEPARPPRPPRPATKREQRQASLARLGEAALELFVAQGYRQTPVEQIGRAAGLTKGAVFFYFGSKSGLLSHLLDGVEAAVVDGLEENLAAAGGDARDQLVAFIHSQARLGVEHWREVLLLILMSLEFADRGELGDRIAAIYRRLYDNVEAIIARGRAQGTFRDDCGAREQAAVVMAGHDGIFLEWHRRKQELQGRELVRALRRTMQEGLLKEEAR
ncbi:MAG: TetR/AcrR family transcriptional regulator [Alphaproteobacteria bacterium]|nr:TetR/AcrR family transcriptional regulator [Alphaproteobacteria bacterium]HJP20058.1 TetR/AcrR family transcriptional regulator [Alphaproteobacteria bacterium]